MKFKTVAPITLAGLLLATSVTYGAGYVSIVKTGIDNTNNPYSVVIQPRKSTCPIGKFSGIVAQSYGAATLYSAVSAAATSGGGAFTVGLMPLLEFSKANPIENPSGIKKCSTTYFVYAQTQSGSHLIGFLKLQYGYQHLSGQTDSRSICHFVAGGSYIDTQSKKIPGDISASVQGGSQCGQGGSVTFNFN